MALKPSTKVTWTDLIQGERREVSMFWITFHDTTFSDTWLIKIRELLLSWNSKGEVCKNSDGRIVYELGLWDYIVEYPSTDKRNTELESRDLVSDSEVTAKWFIKSKYKGKFDFLGRPFCIYWASESAKDTEKLPFAFHWIVVDTKSFIDTVMSDED